MAGAEPRPMGGHIPPLPREIFFLSCLGLVLVFRLHKRVWRGQECLLPELEEVTLLLRQLLNHSEKHLPPPILAKALLLPPLLPSFCSIHVIMN